jgi:hypothetical protein
MMEFHNKFGILPAISGFQRIEPSLVPAIFQFEILIHPRIISWKKKDIMYAHFNPDGDFRNIHLFKVKEICKFGRCLG